MKRSDVINIISECLVEPHFPYDIQKEAEYILHRLEKTGMLPPERYRKIKEHSDMIYAHYIQLPSKVNKWEPESD